MSVVTAGDATNVLQDYDNVQNLRNKVEARIDELQDKFEPYKYGSILVHDSEEWGTRNLTIYYAELDLRKPTVVCRCDVDGDDYAVWYCIRNNAWYAAEWSRVELFEMSGVVEVDPEYKPKRLTEVGEGNE